MVRLALDLGGRPVTGPVNPHGAVMPVGFDPEDLILPLLDERNSG